jgi:vacuolar-type H+-ATPase subunit E/Vma4
MSYEKLIDVLLQDGSEKIREIWREAETKAKEILAEKERKINEIKKRYEQLIQDAVKEQIDAINLDAEKEAKRIKLIAQQKFFKKLYDLSLSMLYLLKEERYRDIFRALSNEIPEYKWDKVFVNEQDISIAKEIFPTLKVIVDNKISGGFIVMTENEDICIDNTFEKRLQRAWIDIIPQLMMEIQDVTKNRK